MGEAGMIMAGQGGRVAFRDAARIAKEYGGNAVDWVKKTSSSFTAKDGIQFETHWVENLQTGQRVEFKTKFPGGGD
jgi:filamentous hemagglutinin